MTETLGGARVKEERRDGLRNLAIVAHVGELVTLGHFAGYESNHSLRYSAVMKHDSNMNDDVRIVTRNSVCDIFVTDALFCLSHVRQSQSQS